MKLKLDENIGCRGQEILRAEGHDVSTVTQQNLTSSADVDLAGVSVDQISNAGLEFVS